MTTENPMLTMIREVCSLGRAEFARPRTVDGDNTAQRSLVAGLLAADAEGNPSDSSLSLDLLAPRAPYFDRLVLDAIGDGITQIVNLGAGYDDRSIRFRSPGITYFELDVPHIIADKTGRLAALGTDTSAVHLAAIDLAQDDVAAVLETVGHDSARPTLFIAEHLALFLEPADVERLVRGIAGRAPAGSRFALTAEAHPEGLDSEVVIPTVDREMFGGVGPLHTILTLSHWQAMLDNAGWTITDEDSVIVDHFPFPLDGTDVQVQTRFLTAETR